MSAGSSDRLISMIDDAVTSLLEGLDKGIRGPGDNQSLSDGASEASVVGFSDRLKAIELGAKWVSIKNKIDSGDTQDEFSRLRTGHLNGSPRKRGSLGASTRSNGSA